ncbi:hypothetical protein HG535_0A01300 [Zygotorulaspora mrakii]|uniref:Diphthamide biosynthesis protein 4 n=1 Tax=Zygotorulaspora mrakii TaxID=42260 RepID=A0A7H9AVH7_ZYGMR|nr:uncharacterized protein HG535_0A01300 [Zygotorulaspora mrakii]QLG70191.1 hypothetical protein HG535_0A01300 [Zygotorulaspora mrakii]
MNKTYYEILGLKSDCSIAEIKKAYREKIVSTHPDKSRDLIQNVDGQLTVDDIQEAYKTLGNEQLRLQYDKQILEGHKKRGYHNSGDGLDEYSLDKFFFSAATMEYSMDCPRCHSKDGFHFSEEALEEHAEEKPCGFQVLSQCSACSLWLKVNFDVAEE